MAKQKTRKVFLDAPKGTKIQRHHIGGDAQEIRFTIPMNGWDKLVGVNKNGQFTWIHSLFRK